MSSPYNQIDVNEARYLVAATKGSMANIYKQIRDAANSGNTHTTIKSSQYNEDDSWLLGVKVNLTDLGFICNDINWVNDRYELVVRW